MGNVRDAMKKREVEEAARVAAPSGGPSDAAMATVPSRPAEARSARALLSVSAGGTNGYSPVLVAHHDRGGPLAEEFRSLRTHLLAQCPEQRFCYVVTSADKEEGKTVTSLNLAMVMAERQEYRTIVVDCDYRKKRGIAGLLKANPTPGMVDVLRGAVKVSEVVQPTVYPNLFVIPAGEARADEVGELVTRPELEEAVAELRRGYDYVLFDTPPVNSFSETSMIGRAVGDALVVVRMNKTHRESVEKAIRLLHATNVRVAGLVLTHRTYPIPRYLYRYS